MKNKTLTIVPLILLLFTGPSFASDPGHHAAIENHDAVSEDEGAGPDESAEILITLEVPLGSPQFFDTPVAILEGEPVTFWDLTKGLASVHSGASGEVTSVAKNYEKVFDRVIATRLIVLEAMTIGLDEIPEIREPLDAFATTTLREMLMRTAFEDIEVDPVELDELYKMMAREVLLTTLEFKHEEDILAFTKEYKSGDDFDKIANIYIEQGRASGVLDNQEYARFQDLLPNIAKGTFALDVGSVSEIFSSSDGYLLFYVVDIRSYEDPLVKAEAHRRVSRSLQREKTIEYREFLEKKYVTINEKLMKNLSFGPKKSGVFGLGEKQPVDYEAMLMDERVVATIHGDEPIEITVGDLVQAIVEKFYHGTESVLERGKDLDAKKRGALQNILFKKVTQIEAISLGLDKTDEYLEAVEQKTDSVLFGAFIDKIIVPDLEITEEEVRHYFDEHIDEFSTPKMLRMSSLVFHEKAAAKKSLAKLKKAADFKWVSANSAGQVEKDTEETFAFDKQLLSLTALPRGLHEAVEDARQGDMLLYASDNGFYYVIVVDAVFAPRPDAYENVRSRIARTIFNAKVEDSLDDWSAKLREAYDVRVFVREFDL